MDWNHWKAHFEKNRARPLPDVARGLESLPAGWRAPLALSIAKFQRGETGEGRIANEVRKLGWEAIDEDYVATLKLFVAEEGRHARILGEMNNALGGRPAPDAWTGRVFELGRRALDPRFELVALLGAEVAAIAAYQAIADRLPPCGLRDALCQIIADEADHLEFHATLFRAAAATPARRAAFAAALSAVLVAATGVLLADHAPLWKTLGVSRRELAHDLRVVGARALAITAPGVRRDPARVAIAA